MTWLLSGGSGFIGRNVASELLRSGIEVVVYDTWQHDAFKQKNVGFSFTNGDVRDETRLREVLTDRQFEGIINLAALKSVSESILNPELYSNINFEAAVKLMDLAIEFEIPHFIQSSSAAVYGNEYYGVVSEKMTAKPISPYGLSKLKAEDYLSSLISKNKISGVSLRYFNVAGAGESSLRDSNMTNVFPIFIELFRSGKSPVIYGYSLETKDGTCIRDYIHVTDLAKAHLGAIQYLRRGQLPPVINLGSGTGTSVLEVFNELKKIMELEIEPTLEVERSGDPVSLIADIQIARDYLNFDPTKTLIDIVISSL